MLKQKDFEYIRLDQNVLLHFIPRISVHTSKERLLEGWSGRSGSEDTPLPAARQVPGAGVLFHGAQRHRRSARQGDGRAGLPVLLLSPHRFHVPTTPEERQVGSGSARDLPNAISARAEMRARSELFSSARELRNPRSPPQGFRGGKQAGEGLRVVNN